MRNCVLFIILWILKIVVFLVNRLWCRFNCLVNKTREFWFTLLHDDFILFKKKSIFHSLVCVRRVDYFLRGEIRKKVSWKKSFGKKSLRIKLPWEKSSKEKSQGKSLMGKCPGQKSHEKMFLDKSLMEIDPGHKSQKIPEQSSTKENPRTKAP